MQRKPKKPEKQRKRPKRRNRKMTNQYSKEQKLTAKEQATIEYYTDPTSETRNNWSKSYKRAGYSLFKGWKRNAARVAAKSHIKVAIREIRAKITTEMDVTREYCIDKLVQIIENSKNERNVISALNAIGDFTGFKREKGLNPEKEAIKAQKMTDEEKEMAVELAKMRTKAVANPNIKLVKAG